MHRLKTILATSGLVLLSAIEASAQEAEGTSFRFVQPSTGCIIRLGAVA